MKLKQTDAGILMAASFVAAGFLPSTPAMHKMQK